MEYERIHKVQSGVISPSKLRMKLIGSHHLKTKDGSNTNSSRTSPSRLEDSEFVRNGLLAAQNGEEEASTLEVPPIICDNSMPETSQCDGNLLQLKELVLRDNGVVSKCDGSNSGALRPVRSCEDENLDYDSTSSFEFHKGERSLHHSVARSLSRPMSSKWNDAEKWIINRQNVHSNIPKKTNLQNQVNRFSAPNVARVGPESTNSENKTSVKKVDICQPASHTGLAKFAFACNGVAPIPGQVNGANAFTDLCPASKDLTEFDDTGLHCTKSVTEETTGVSAIRSVSMRDMGTEMTPIPSQEPSRSATPVGATTPLRTPTSSIPSTPRTGQPAPTTTEHSNSKTTQYLAENGKKELSEQEIKHNTRREIVALGVQLGKMNIAAWASKDEKAKSISGNEIIDVDELEQIEYATRAAAWEEAEKSKYAARFKRDVIRIQAWESQKKAKLEAEMRQIEAKIEQMRAQAQAKMVKKVALARQKSEEKRAAVETRINRQADKTAAQAEYISKTGRITMLSSSSCCGWW